MRLTLVWRGRRSHASLSSHSVCVDDLVKPVGGEATRMAWLHPLLARTVGLTRHSWSPGGGETQVRGEMSKSRDENEGGSTVARMGRVAVLVIRNASVPCRRIAALARVELPLGPPPADCRQSSRTGRRCERAALTPDDVPGRGGWIGSPPPGRAQGADRILPALPERGGPARNPCHRAGHGTLPWAATRWTDERFGRDGRQASGPRPHRSSEGRIYPTQFLPPPCPRSS
jgi:hypothetical protein